jgi:hypothetical protein
LNRERSIAFLVRAAEPFTSDDELPSPEGLDWPFLLDAAFRHRVAAMIGARLVRSGAIEQESRHEYALDALLAASSLNERRNRVLVQEAVRLVGLLRAAGIPTALRKGAYLTPAVYRDLGLRPMNDIDLFVDRSASQGVAEILSAEGYAPGTVDARGRITPLTRRQSVFWNVHVNNLPSYHRRCEDPLLPSIAVDVCFDLFLPASGCALPAHRLLTQTRTFEADGQSLPVFRPEHFLIDVAAHLYKESTTLRYIEKGKHQRLLQYVDLVAVVRSQPTLDWDVVTATAAEAGASANVYFALANAERLYPGTIPPSVLKTLAADGQVGKTFLREYGTVDLSRPLTWKATNIVERLFSDERPGAGSQSPV